MFLTPRLALAVALVSAVALVASGGVAVLVADLVLAAVAAVDVWRAAPPRSLIHRRDHAPVMAVDREDRVGLLVRHTGGRSVRVLVRDLVPPSLRPTPPRIDARVVPGPSTLRYTVRPARRGRFELGPVVIRTFGPLGLAGRQGVAEVRSTLKVYPHLPGRRQVEGRLRRTRLLEVGSRSARIRGRGLEFDSLREYHPDDEFRRINWVATARSPRAIANVHREERNQQVLLMLDAGRALAGTVAGAPRYEHALDASVALASLAVTVGDRVGAFVFMDRVLAGVPPRADAAQPGRILDALFDVEPQPHASDYLGATGTTLARFRRRAMIVMFSDLADEAALDPLLRAVPILARRHLVVVAEVSDPHVRATARSVPGSAAAAYRKAAAVRTEAQREVAARRLAQLGASVVDSPPGELAVALADEYLRAKAFGRL